MREARIEKTPEGQVPVGGGWFVLNLGDMAWETIPGFGSWRGFDDPDITIGDGDEPCAILMFGSPDPARKVEWIANETAANYGASVTQTTGRDTDAYGDLPAPVRVRPPKPFGTSPYPP